MSTLREAIQKMAELKKLPRGWNYGRGGPLTEKALLLSVLTLHFLDSIGAKRFDILPSDDGGATLLASFNEDTAEILVQKDGTFDLFLEGPTCLDFEGLDFGRLISALESAGWKSLKSSGSQTHVFTVLSTEDLPVRLSPTMGMAHRLWRQGAFSRPAQHYAPISPATTEASVESRQSFFGSQPRTLLMAHG